MVRYLTESRGAVAAALARVRRPEKTGGRRHLTGERVAGVLGQRRWTGTVDGGS